MARFRRSRPTHLLALNDVGPEQLRLDVVGSNALQLTEAAARGASVAGGWILPAPAFREVVRNALPPAHDPASLLRVIHRPAGVERAARARERLYAVPLPDALQKELAALCAGAHSSKRWGFAVRASPTCSDDTIAVAAGLMATTYSARDERELDLAVRLTWAACFHEDTLCYLRARRVRDVAMALLIEPLDAVVASGVLLTRDPEVSMIRRDEPDASQQDGAIDEPVRVASIALGLGAPVVDGALMRDLVRFRSDGSIVEERVAQKQRRIVIDGVREIVAVAREASVKPALGPQALAALGALAARLDDHSPSAFAADFLVPEHGEIRLGNVWKTRGNGFPDGGGASTVWSRAGLGESVPGVPAPLTASLAEAFEERRLRDALSAIGCKPSRGDALISRVQGRYYLNLSALVPALAEVPGIDPATLLEFVQSEASHRLADELEVSRRAGSLARLPITAARLHALQRRLVDDVHRFEPEAEQQRSWLQEMDLGILPDDALRITLFETRDFFERTARLLLGCSVAALAAHASLKTVLARSAPIEAERLAQLITAGAGDLATAAPGVALCHVIAIIDKDPETRRAILDPGVRELGALPAGTGRRALGQFFEAYGDRCIREGELAAPRFAEVQQPVLDMVRAGLRAGRPVDPERNLSLARVTADRELAALEARVPYVERALIRALLIRCREIVRLRERMRVWLARTLGMLRTVALDVDRRLRRLDTSLEVNSVFYCTFDELVSAAGSARADLGPIVRLRRAAYERDADRPDPPETFVGAPPPFALPPVGNVVLHGRGAGPGVVVGRARLLDSRGGGAERLQPGEILVTRSLDVGFTALFFLAGALVSELGSVMSHGAVVARECALPTVAGVPLLTQTIRDGERLRVDGDRGTVERLDS
jgi:pyruvate,water dikinase